MIPVPNPRVRRRLVRGAGGLLLGVALLLVSLALVGVETLDRVLSTVPPQRVRSLLVVGVVPLVIWGLGLSLVFDGVGVRVRTPRAVLLYGASGFLNAVTPFGQAGGDPATALLFRRAIGTDFETGLVAIGSLNALNRVAVVTLGLLGVGYLGSSIVIDETVRTAAVLVTGLAVGSALVLVVVWRYRYRVVSAFAAGVTWVLRRGARPLPRVTAPSRDSLERRGYRFVGAIDRLAADPRRLAVVFGLSVAGQLAVASGLWLALASLGVDVPLEVVLLVIPVGKLAGIAPTPGGLGSSEALLVVLLTSTTGTAAAVAGAAALLYRASAFWVPSLVGGLICGWFVVTGDGADRSGDGPPRPRAGRDREPASEGWQASATRSTLPRLLVGFAASFAVLLTLVVHRSHLVVEPHSIVVHAVRDTSLALLAFAIAWVLARRVPREWFG